MHSEIGDFPMSYATGFEGIPEGTFQFLRSIAEHNTKAWFDGHRDDYEQFYVAPAKALVSALGPRLRKISKSVKFEPRVNGSVFLEMLLKPTTHNNIRQWNQGLPHFPYCRLSPIIAFVCRLLSRNCPQIATRE